METKKIIKEELKKLALVVSIEGEGCDAHLSEAIPVPLAQQLNAALVSRGVEASWAPDDEDRDLAWVYVLDMEAAS